MTTSISVYQTGLSIFGGGSQGATSFAGDVAPAADNQYDLGTAALSWRNLYFDTAIFGGVVTGAWSPSAADTYSLGSATAEWKSLFLGDDAGVFIGLDQDSVVYHRTATLTANTALASVLLGTPVSQALAANSLMISNVTASGDIALYVNTGGHSQQLIFLDGSAGTLIFPLGYQTYGSVTVNANGIHTTPTYRLDVVGNSGNNTHEYVAGFWSDDDNSGLLKLGAFTASGGNRYASIQGTVHLVLQRDSGNIILRSGLSINAGFTGLIDPDEGVDGDYFTFGARDSDTDTIVEVGRVFGAADPYFSMGGSQQFKFYNSGAAALVPTSGSAVDVGVSCNFKRFYAEVTLSTTGAETDVGLTPSAVILSAAIRVSVEIADLDSANHHIQLGINGTPAKYIDVAQGAAATTISVNKKGNYKFDPTTDTEATALKLTITGGADQTPTAGKVYVEVIYLDSANLADV